MKERVSVRWKQRRRRPGHHLRPAPGLCIKRARFPRTFCIRPHPRHGVGDAGPSPLRSKLRPVEPIPCRLSLPCAADGNISDFVFVSQGCLRCRRSRTWIPRIALALTNTNHPSHLQTHSLQVPPVGPRPQRQRARAYAAYVMLRFRKCI